MAMWCALPLTRSLSLVEALSLETPPLGLLVQALALGLLISKLLAAPRLVQTHPLETPPLGLLLGFVALPVDAKAFPLMPQLAGFPGTRRVLSASTRSASAQWSTST
jgi:hypothetical protein